MAALELRLPSDLESALRPLFEALPLDKAMPELCPMRPTWEAVYEVADQVVRDPIVADHPALVAGLWLYADDLDRSHRISQEMHDEAGSMWHAIMHRREGDFSNAAYWLSRTAAHPALATFDSRAFLREVEQHDRENPADLVEKQRQEWSLLFSWCAERVSS